MNTIDLERIIRLITNKTGGARRIILALMIAAAVGSAVLSPLAAQRRPPLTEDEKAKRWEIENELSSLAVIERKLMIPMRDGVRIAADVYSPKDASRKYPATGCARPTISTTGISPTAAPGT